MTVFRSPSWSLSFAVSSVVCHVRAKRPTKSSFHRFVFLLQELSRALRPEKYPTTPVSLGSLLKLQTPWASKKILAMTARQAAFSGAKPVKAQHDQKMSSAGHHAADSRAAEHVTLKRIPYCADFRQ